MDSDLQTAETATTRRIQEGDCWDYSVTGFLAGGFKVVPLSGSLRCLASFRSEPAPDGAEIFALGHALALSSVAGTFSDQGAVYFRQQKDRSLEECGTRADGWIRKGPGWRLPGTLSTHYRGERALEYRNGATEEGATQIIAAREIETPMGEHPAFKVEDLYKRTEPDGAFVRVNDTGWFVPALGFFARGSVTIRSYDPRGRFRTFQLHGFQLKGTSVTV